MFVVYLGLAPNFENVLMIRILNMYLHSWVDDLESNLLDTYVHQNYIVTCVRQATILKDEKTDDIYD